MGQIADEATMNPILSFRGAFLLLFVAAAVFPGPLLAQVNYVERVLLPAGHNPIVRMSMEPLQTQNPLYDPGLDGHEIKVVTTEQIYYANGFTSTPGSLSFAPGFVPFSSGVSLIAGSVVVETNRQLDYSAGSNEDDDLIIIGSREALYQYDFDLVVPVNTDTMSNPGFFPNYPNVLAVGQGLYMLGCGNKVYDLTAASYNADNGAFTFLFGGTGTGNGQFTNLTEMAFGPGPNGLFYCLDWVPAPGTPRVEVFDPTDPNQNYYRYSFNLPAGLAVTNTAGLGFAINDVGHLFVSDGQGGGVELDLNGNVLGTFDPPSDDVADPNASASDTSYLTFDAAGDIFVENGANGLHRYVDPLAVQNAQTISFPTIGDQTYGSTPITLAQTASSGLPVTYATTGPIQLSNNTATFTGVGAATITASQPGGVIYFPATPVTQTFNVNPAVLAYAAKPVVRAFGYPNPTFTGAVTGFVNGDTLTTATTGTLTFTTSANSTSSAGNYAIEGSGLSAVNYTFTQEPGNSVALAILSAPTLNQWETAYGISGASPPADGIPYLLQFLCGIDPTMPATVADQSALPSVSVDTTTHPGRTDLTLIYRQGPLAAGVTATVQNSADLQTWTTVPANQLDINQVLSTDPTTGDFMVEVGIPLTGSIQFMRLDVTGP